MLLVLVVPDEGEGGEVGAASRYHIVVVHHRPA